MEPMQFGKYTLLEHMGKGGMASVYRASDNEDGSIVAVKVFEPSPDRTPETTRKLRDREVRMLVSVQHPNIVKFHESGQVDENCYYAMEFVENSLQKRMRDGRDLTLVDKVLILRQTVGALTAVHHKGIVHRDIKPGNILLDQDPNGVIHVKLTDLGIAKNVSETDVVREQMPTRVPGTAKYLSPEQVRLQAVDGRSDIFGLGVVAYELLAGTTPFKAETVEEYLVANCQQKQMPVHKLTAEVPPFVGAIVERMLAKDREERYDSDTLSRDLELVQQHLVSNAPMVERTNPVSMFYVQPVEAEGGPGAPGRAVAPVSWALAFAVVLLGAIAAAVFWPRGASALPQGLPVADEPPAPRDMLREAESAAGAGRQWQALMLIRSLPKDDLPAPERDRFQALSGSAQNALAEEPYAAAANMLAQARRAEADVVLAQMQDFFPLTGRTRELAAAVSRPQAGSTPDSEWQEALRNTYAQVRRGQYKEALDARRKLLAQASAGPDKAETARRTIGDLLDHWARSLAETRPTADALEDFFAMAAAQKEVAPGKPSPALAAALRMKLARVYQDRGDSDAALRQYDLAVSGGDDAVAAEAKQARDALQDWLSSRPHEAEDFGRELARVGFESDLWRDVSDPGGGQEVSAGVLRLVARGAAARAVAYRESARPVRNLGFTASVQLRPSAELLGRPGSAQAGIAAVGTNGTVCELAFDGRSYVVSIGGRGGQASAAAPVLKAVGDEAEAWHTLALSYNYNTGQLTAMLDGEVLRRYALDLSNFRLRVFVAATPGSSASAEFKDVTCRP